MDSGSFPYPAYPRTPYPPLIVNAALTGMVAQRDRVPYLPLTAEEIVENAERCFRAGATVLHVHARDETGRPEWRRDAYSEIIAGIRERCPGAVVCATTSGRDVGEVDKRADVLLLEGASRPDMASLTLGSLNFHTGPSVNAITTIEELARRMTAAGVRPELEMFDLGMAHLAQRLVKKGLVEPPLYANLLLGFPNGAPADGRGLVALVQSLEYGTIWGAGGMGAYQLPANALATAMGGHVRTGLEDNAWIDAAGRTPATNEALVQRVARLAKLLGRRPAEPAEARAALGLPVAVAVGALAQR